MIKKYSFLGIVLIILGISSCTLNSKFIQSGDYQLNSKVSDLHLIVIGDKETKDAMDYLAQFLTDSLVSNSVKTTMKYHCCRSSETNLNVLIPSLLPVNYKPENVLTVVISKVIVGYGTTSSREVQLDLFTSSFQKRTWTGNVKVNMSWFISDQDYRNVATSLTKAIIAELKKKKIV